MSLIKEPEESLATEDTNSAHELFNYKKAFKEKDSIRDHRERLVYWGTIATDKIIQILPFGKEWINAIDEMRKIDPTIDRDINFRIYKDFESLREYQSQGIGKLKDKIITT